jgi:hypothetical protein
VEKLFFGGKVMAIYHGDFNCDSCSAWFDGDPVSLLARTPKLFGLTNPEKIKELTYFWLCRECRVDYPNGAQDFFVPDYFTNDEEEEEEPEDPDGVWFYVMCGECGDEIGTITAENQHEKLPDLCAKCSD